MPFNCQAAAATNTMLWRHSRPILQSCTKSWCRVLRLHAPRTVSSTTKAGRSIASILALPSPGPDQQHPRIEVTGHIRTIRNQKRRSFVKLGDGSTTSELQALLKPAQAEWYVAQQDTLRVARFRSDRVSCIV